MNLSDHDFRALWRERSAGATTERSGCLTDADWTRLLSGEASARERVTLATHIASCADCADEYRLLEPLQSWIADVERVVSPPHAAPSDRWTAWRSWPGLILAAFRPHPDDVERTFHAWWASPRFILATATGLLVIQGVVLSLLVNSRRANTLLEAQLAENTQRLSSSAASLDALQDRLRRETAEKEQLAASEQQRLARLTTPQLDATILDLEPQYAAAVRGTSDPQIVTTAPEALTATLILNFPPLSSPATLEVEVADANGQIRWAGRTRRNQDAAALTLALPTAGYPAGRYVIRLFDVTRGRTVLATYPVEIRSAR